MRGFPDTARGPRRRTVRAVAGAALVLAAVGAAVLVSVQGGGADPASSAPATASGASQAPEAGPGADPAPSPGQASGSPTSAPPTSGPATSAPATAAPVVVDELPPVLPAVDLTEPAEVGDGISAAIVSVEPVRGTGTGPGNVAGPAVRLVLEIENGTSEPVPLDGVAVALASGEELDPAPPLDDPSAQPFTGSVAPGGRAEATYVFGLAEDQRSAVTLTVGYRAGAPFMVFTGPLR